MLFQAYQEVEVRLEVVGQLLESVFVVFKEREIYVLGIGVYFGEGSGEELDQIGSEEDGKEEEDKREDQD